MCGVICSECPAFIATQKNDDNEKKKVAEIWSKEFKIELKPEDINCYGCLIESEKVLGYCNICEIRRCGKNKNLKNCAYYGEYKCEKLINFFKMAPKAETAIDEIKNKL